MIGKYISNFLSLPKLFLKLFFYNNIKHLNIITYKLRINKYFHRSNGWNPVAFMVIYFVSVLLIINCMIHLILCVYGKESCNVAFNNVFSSLIFVIFCSIFSRIFAGNILFKSGKNKTCCIKSNTPYIHINNNWNKFYILSVLSNGSYLCQTRSQINKSTNKYLNILYEVISPDKNVINVKCKDNFMEKIIYNTKRKLKKHKKCGIKYFVKYEKKCMRNLALSYIIFSYILICVISLIIFVFIPVFLFSGLKF